MEQFPKKCNNLCALFQKTQVQSGVIVYSDLLVDYLKKTVSESLSGFYNDKQSFKSIKRIAAASER